jgi:tRNA G18 (ribose-2'-O)-methylase SpoU
VNPRPIEPIRIDHPDDPRIGEFRALRENRLHAPAPEAPHGVFIAEGEKVVRLLARGERFRTRAVLIAAERLERDGSWLAAFAADVPIYAAPRPTMDAIVGFPIHRGVLASGLRRPDPTPAELLHGASAVVALEGTANHDNLGGIFRAAAALADRPAVLLDPTCCDPLYRKAIRVSMGHALRVPFARLAPWPSGLAGLADAGFETIALTTDAGAEDIAGLQPHPGRKPALLLGAEGGGLSPAAAAMARRRVRIAMTSGVDSLNVVTAAAIALHRLARNKP